jgi:hypothetical protein
METDRMQTNYRAIFTEMLTAQAAAVGALAGVTAGCALLAGQEYQAALARLAAEIRAKGAGAGPTQPGGGSGITGASLPLSANLYRAFAGLPRVAMMSFLSQYDDLRGRRGVVRDLTRANDTAE